MTAITTTSPNFASELALALKESSFGLKEYQVTQETQLESTATVVLLEGNTITVSLSPRGFEVSSTVATPLIETHLRHRKLQVLGQEARGVFHETLEQLLDSQSPAYRLASQQALFSRLDQLVNERDGRSGER